MKTAAVLFSFLTLAVLLTGCVEVRDGGVFINFSSTTNLTVAEIPGQASVCVWGLPTPQDAELESNVTCQGRNVSVRLRYLMGENQTLDGCSAVWLRGDQAGRFLSRDWRIRIRDSVEAGRSLFVDREAATLDADDEAINGWEPGLGHLVPTRLTGPGPSKQAFVSKPVSGVLLGTGPGLEALEGREAEAWMFTRSYTDELTFVALRAGEFVTDGMQPAVTYKDVPTPQGSLAAARSYWFAFDPAEHAPDVFQALLGQAVLDRLAFQKLVC